MQIDTYQDYAIFHNCSLAEAIADRDVPMDEETCIRVFCGYTGSNPTPQQILTMRPDSDAACKEQRAQWLEELRNC